MPASEILPAEEVVRIFSLRLRLARSAELALAGSFLRAEGLLMRMEKLPKTAEEFDLLARILVQQKRYFEAEKRWIDALRISDDKPCYQDAINSLNTYIDARRRSRKRIFLFLASTLILIFVVILISILIKGFHLL